MTWVLCRDCGHHFERREDEAWKVRCLDCFKKSKQRATAADNPWILRAAAAERQLAELRTQLAISQQTIRMLTVKKPVPVSSVERELAENWRALAQLTHPDKHGGSQGANRVSQWLNSVKGRLPCI